MVAGVHDVYRERCSGGSLADRHVVGRLEPSRFVPGVAENRDESPVRCESLNATIRRIGDEQRAVGRDRDPAGILEAALGTTQAAPHTDDVADGIEDLQAVVSGIRDDHRAAVASRNSARSLERPRGVGPISDSVEEVIGRRWIGGLPHPSSRGRAARGGHERGQDARHDPSEERRRTVRQGQRVPVTVQITGLGPNGCCGHSVTSSAAWGSRLSLRGYCRTLLTGDDPPSGLYPLPRFLQLPPDDP